LGIQISGWGCALPEKVVTNADFASRLDTTDEWIIERTGIRERRFGGTSGSLAVEAGQRALDVAGVDPSSVDLVVLATTTPDRLMPATAAYVQDALGCNGAAMDLNAACSGFVYALITGAGICELGATRALVIGADVMSRIVDQDDRGTAVLFGDGAGAVVLDRIDGPSALIGWDLGGDGSLRHLLNCEFGGYTFMAGKEVFRQAVRVMVDSCQSALSKAGIRGQDVTLLVPHQANTRIVAAACDRLGISMERTALVLERTGNTSAASIPLALVDAVENGRLQDGDLVLMSGFGAGMTWASAVLQWRAQ
jgi:3-oxoacyl-[acyl-carrier-protein] synthase III